MSISALSGTGQNTSIQQIQGQGLAQRASAVDTDHDGDNDLTEKPSEKAKEAAKNVQSLPVNPSLGRNLNISV